MNSSFFRSQLWIVLTFLVIVTSCKPQIKTATHGKEEGNLTGQMDDNPDSQIGEYVIGVFEDSKGNLWLSTLTKGVARFDGNTFSYFNTQNGFNGDRGGSIIEDSNGELWFGTHSGISKYDGKTFTHFNESDGLCDNQVSNLILDRKGDLWIGTWGGVCKFDGERFTDFPLPNPPIDPPSYQATMHWISEIMEDSKGNIWIARQGYGACRYDGESFTHFTKKEGLPSNSVTDIQEDAQGNIWFGTRVTEKDHPDPDQRDGPGGLVKYDGTTFEAFPDKKGLSGSDVNQIYRDREDNIWISTLQNGVYRYDGKQFRNFSKRDSGHPFSNSIVSILKDSKGKVWLGCAGGLFRLDSEGIVNVTTEGPWD